MRHNMARIYKIEIYNKSIDPYAANLINCVNVCSIHFIMFSHFYLVYVRYFQNHTTVLLGLFWRCFCPRAVGGHFVHLKVAAALTKYYDCILASKTYQHYLATIKSCKHLGSRPKRSNTLSIKHACLC